MVSTSSTPLGTQGRIIHGNIVHLWKNVNNLRNFTNIDSDVSGCMPWFKIALYIIAPLYLMPVFARSVFICGCENAVQIVYYNCDSSCYI